MPTEPRTWPARGTARPYIRWWWLNGPFREADIDAQLRWFSAMGFGGVELAWIHPGWQEHEEIARPAWLGPEWSRIVAHAKRSAESLGLGCDFTFGSVWPFGGTCITPGHASQSLDGPSGQRLDMSWEEPEAGRVLDHLSAGALDHYFRALAPAFAGGLAGGTSALFCDSLEVDKGRLWSPALWEEFERRCGYSLRENLDLLDPPDADPAVLYDYRRTVAEAIVREFYRRFGVLSRSVGAVARVQCHGAPADLLEAYAEADVPESETLLFPPAFSRIAASAAALAGRPVVSCETFTCLHGFPRGADMVNALQAWKKERVEDLKLLADAVIAHGVNHVVWHGAPYNPPGGTNEFYASVHVGPDSPLVPHLPAFNAYLERVCARMRAGRPCTRLAVYLPNEDMMLAGPLPEAGRSPGAVDQWEMRTVVVPRVAEGFAPLWISRPFLAAGRVEDGVLVVGDLRLPALLVDVEWLDGGSLVEILRLARAGLPVAVPRRPRRPGRAADAGYEGRLDELVALPTVRPRLGDLPVLPLVEGADLPPFWARESGPRESGGEVHLFLAHPAAREVRYPMPVGAASALAREERRLRIRAGAVVHDVALSFPPGASLLIRAGAGGVEVKTLEPPGAC